MPVEGMAAERRQFDKAEQLEGWISINFPQAHKLAHEGAVFLFGHQKYLSSKMWLINIHLLNVS